MCDDVIAADALVLEELTVGACGIGDVGALALAAVLPLCGALSLKRLELCRRARHRRGYRRSTHLRLVSRSTADTRTALDYYHLCFWLGDSLTRMLFVFVTMCCTCVREIGSRRRWRVCWRRRLRNALT